jgi:hypothetical protein
MGTHRTLVPTNPVVTFGMMGSDSVMATMLGRYPEPRFRIWKGQDTGERPCHHGHGVKRVEGLFTRGQALNRTDPEFHAFIKAPW